jgi:hypothetical protein
MRHEYKGCDSTGLVDIRIRSLNARINVLGGRATSSLNMIQLCHMIDHKKSHR